MCCSGQQPQSLWKSHLCFWGRIETVLYNNLIIHELNKHSPLQNVKWKHAYANLCYLQLKIVCPWISNSIIESQVIFLYSINILKHGEEIVTIKVLMWVTGILWEREASKHKSNIALHVSPEACRPLQSTTGSSLGAYAGWTPRSHEEKG